MTASERRGRERQQRRQVIITAARQLAEAEGWSAVTTRRLADLIEYSQPVLYSHFDSKDAIVEAVAIKGFDELAVILADAGSEPGDTDEALRRCAHAYLNFARTNPALYEAMFSLASDLPFGRPEAPASLHESFARLRDVVGPFTGGNDPSTFTEVVWSALHGLATLDRAHRLRADRREERLALLVDRFTGRTTSTSTREAITTVTVPGAATKGTTQPRAR
jgi:AcrR family transcriptional regulator